MLLAAQRRISAVIVFNKNVIYYKPCPVESWVGRRLEIFNSLYVRGALHFYLCLCGRLHVDKKLYAHT